MTGLEGVRHKGELLAQIIRKGYGDKGVNFITLADEPLQVGILVHPMGKRLAAHVHKKAKKVIREVQEVLYILHGSVRIDFYSEEQKLVESKTLNSGDTIILLRGGHGLSILEDSKIMEVKQGPYRGVEEDKSVWEV